MMVQLYIQSNDHQYILNTLFDKIGDFLKRNETTEEVQKLLKVFLFDDIPALADFIKNYSKWTIRLDKINLCYSISLPFVGDIKYAEVSFIAPPLHKNKYYWFG